MYQPIKLHSSSLVNEIINVNNTTQHSICRAILLSSLTIFVTSLYNAGKQGKPYIFDVMMDFIVQIYKDIIVLALN